MTKFSAKSAIVIGGGTGVGRATALALSAEGARVWAVGRDAARLETVRREGAPGSVEARAFDATDPVALESLLDEANPDLVVVSAGVRPRLTSIVEHTWQSFSEAWNTDTKLAFLVGQAALRRPLRAGSTVLIVSSGAGIGGSPLSGGYAGAKRMQMFLATYFQGASEAAKLGIRFVALAPKQLLAGTVIGASAAKGYAERLGISEEKYMERFGAPLGADDVAKTILDIARGEIGSGSTVLALSSKTGIETL
jgi:NAD(P)-dependent dehydrogenase (short-subunit alcohol dehydrogenase family)